jgi:hypothetical protein
MFTAEQSATFYTDLAIGFDEENHTFGTVIADGILNVLHPSFVPPPEPEVIDVDNDRNVRQRAAPDTTNDALLHRILQLEENLADQRRQEEQLRTTHQATSTAAPAQLRPSLCNPTTGPLTTGRATFDLPFDRVVSEYERRWKMQSNATKISPQPEPSPHRSGLTFKLCTDSFRRQERQLPVH